MKRRKMKIPKIAHKRRDLPFLRVKDLKALENAIKQAMSMRPDIGFTPQNALLGRSMQGTIGGMKGVKGLPSM